jgi:hypothetical protein
MLRAALLVIWLLFALGFTFQALAGWIFYRQITLEGWHHEPPVRAYRNKLLGLTLAVIPFNVLSLLSYGGLLSALSPRPTAGLSWLFLTLSAGWLGGLGVSSRCMSMSAYLKHVRAEYERYQSRPSR